MRPIPRLSLSTRIALLVAGSLLLLTVAISSVFAYLKYQDIDRITNDRLRVAMSVFGHEVDHQSDGLVKGDLRPGMITALVRTDQPLAVTAALVDEMTSLVGAKLTYFERDPASGQFIRTLTSLKGPDGQRLTGTRLNPDGPVQAALSRGDRYVGIAAIQELEHHSIYEPVFDARGTVVGAVAAALPGDTILTNLAEFLARLLLPMLAVLLLGVPVTHMWVRRQLRPLAVLVKSVGRLAQRDYETEIEAVDTADDVGDLTRACIALRGALRDAAQLEERAALQEQDRERLRKDLSRVVDDLRAGLSRLAEGDLTTRIQSPPADPFPGEYDSLRHSYNAVLDRVSSVINSVTATARDLRDSAAEITEASRELSGRAETQAATLEQSAAALTELTQSVGSTADRAGKAQEASFGNRTGAERGAEIVRDAVTAMQGIERGSEQITRIIGVIDDIAFQTNLLALNAGVEAARAGDAGRGFAVVASEVRLLAQRASESAREIRGLISDSSQQVGQGSALVRRAGESLAEILGRANDAAGLVAEIARAAAEQARGLAEVNAAVNQLDHVTQQNSAVAEETSAAAATLKLRSEELLLALGGFRTDQDPRSAPMLPAAASRPDALPAAPETLVEAKVVDWVPAVAAATSSRRANRSRQTGTWAEF